MSDIEVQNQEQSRMSAYVDFFKDLCTMEGYPLDAVQLPQHAVFPIILDLHEEEIKELDGDSINIKVEEMVSKHLEQLEKYKEDIINLIKDPHYKNPNVYKKFKFDSFCNLHKLNDLISVISNLQYIRSSGGENIERLALSAYEELKGLFREREEFNTRDEIVKSNREKKSITYNITERYIEKNYNDYYINPEELSLDEVKELIKKTVSKIKNSSKFNLRGSLISKARLSTFTSIIKPLSKLYIKLGDSDFLDDLDDNLKLSFQASRKLNYKQAVDFTKGEFKFIDGAINKPSIFRRVMCYTLRTGDARLLDIFLNNIGKNNVAPNFNQFVMGLENKDIKKKIANILLSKLSSEEQINSIIPKTAFENVSETLFLLINNCENRNIKQNFIYNFASSLSDKTAEHSEFITELLKNFKNENDKEEFVKTLLLNPAKRDQVMNFANSKGFSELFNEQLTKIQQEEVYRAPSKESIRASQQVNTPARDSRLISQGEYRQRLASKLSEECGVKRSPDIN